MHSTSQRRVKQGAALVTVLMVVGIATVASSALIGSAFFNLNVSVSQDTTNIARNLADSAMHVAAENALENQTLFTPGPGVTLYPVFNVAPDPGSAGGTQVDSPNPGDGGMVTFKQQTQIPWSLFNLGPGAVSLHGFNGRNVPPNALHLVGIGTCRSSQVVTEAIVYLPPYPYVVCANGALSVVGNLMVGSVNSSTTLDGPGLSNLIANPKNMLPGDIANNSNAANSMTLNPNGQQIYIAGNAQTSSNNINTPSGMANITIGGSEDTNSDPAPTPSININSYDPSAFGPNPQPGVATVVGTAAAPLSGVYNLSGYGYSHGDLWVQGGTLNLNGGILYVNGNLNINNVGMNAIQGTGAVFCTGNVIVNGPTQLASDDSLALCAKGDITIEGAGPVMDASPSFTGLLYTEGNLNLDNVSVVGSYVATGSSGIGGPGNVNVTNANIISAPDKGTISMPQPVGGYPVETVQGAPAQGAGGVYGASFYQLKASATYSAGPPVTVMLSGITMAVTAGQPVPVAVPAGPMTQVALKAWYDGTFLPAIGVTTPLMKGQRDLVTWTAGINSQITGYEGGVWSGPPPPGGTVEFPPGGTSTNDPTLSFNEFIDPMDQARILIWQSPTPMAPIFPAPF